jgi:hypothetical protein
MFKLLTTFVMLALLGIVAYVIYRLVKDTMDSAVKNANNATNPPPAGRSQDIDEIIAELRMKIQISELQAESGMFEAKEQLEAYKTQLKKAKEYKNKFNQ